MSSQFMFPNMANTGFVNPSMMGMGMPMGGVSNYANDIFAPDFIKNPYKYMYQGNNQSYSNTQNNVSPQPQSSGSIFNNTEEQKVAQPQSFTARAEEIRDNTVNLTTSENGNLYNKTNTAKKTLTFLGALTPVATSAYKAIKSAKISDVFKLKELGLKIPAFAIAGWCIGALVDGIINSGRAQTVDKAS